MVRAHASHQCGRGSIPGLGVICRLSLLFVLVLAPRGFSPCTPVFPSYQKPIISKFQFSLETILLPYFFLFICFCFCSHFCWVSLQSVKDAVWTDSSLFLLLSSVTVVRFLASREELKETYFSSLFPIPPRSLFQFA